MRTSFIVLGLFVLVSAVALAQQRPQDAPLSSLTIHKAKSSPSALDVHLDGTGKAVRIFAPEFPPSNPRRMNADPGTYFNDSGMLYTRGWIVVSGVTEGTGDGYNIIPPTGAPSMIAVWSDVLGPAIQVRAANAGPESYLFQGLNRGGSHTFSIEQDGGLQWGAGKRKEMDLRLYRASAKTLRTDGALVVGQGIQVDGSQTVKRTLVTTDYTVRDGDYYLGVTQGRTIRLPSAKGRTGRVVVVKDESGTAGRFPITVSAAAGETLDGSTAAKITKNYGSLKVISSGRSWFSY